MSARAPAPRPPEIVEASVAELLGTYTDVLGELSERDIVRTANSPIGDYAEYLFCSAFGWERAGAAEKAVDAIDHATGLRFQIKARRLLTSGTIAQLGGLRELESHRFDMLAAVIFDERMKIRRAALVPYALVSDSAKDTPWVNGKRIITKAAFWSHPEVQDVTGELSAAAAKL